MILSFKEANAVLSVYFQLKLQLVESILFILRDTGMSGTTFSTTRNVKEVI